MLFVRLISFLRGYVVVSVRGQYPERLINICAARGILLWGVFHSKSSGVTACMSIMGFRRIAPIAKKSGCRVRIIERRGLPFLIHKHRKRYAFGAGIVFFLIVCRVLSMFIWKVEITGSEELDRKALSDSLARHGLHMGVWAAGIDNNAVKHGVMTDMEEVAWIGITVNGSGAEVEVRKRVPKPGIVDKNRACSLVASQNGVVTALNISEGVTYVDLGNVVYKGQLLVSGIIESSAVGIRTVAAAGTVTATTWHEKTCVIPEREEIRSRTGQTKSKHTLEVFGKIIPLFFSDKVSFENFDRESYIKKIWENDKFSLPFCFHYDKFYDVDIKYRKLTEKQAAAKAKKQLCAEIEQELSESARVISVSHWQDRNENGQPTITVSYECSENIAEEKEALYEPLGENNGSREDGGDN